VDRTAETFTARDENTRLKRDLARSNQELFQLRARIAEEDRLKLLLSAGAALPAVRMAAPVLLIETRAGGQSALIGAGSSSGVVPGSPIAVPEGLVGRLVTVGATVSRAQLLLDASAAAGARIVKTGELGVIRGDGRGGLRLNNVATTSRVAPGDEIESAGIDGIYPRGVPIGRVASVERGSMFLEIRVVPAAPFSRLTDVLVLEPSPALSGPGGGQGSGGP
jgi:rod shape-determining protein MreC